MSLLKIEHLRKEFENVTPIQDLSLEVEEGEVISIIGPSGTGKSTLLRCINQLEEPTSGTVIFDGQTLTDADCDIAAARRKIGMVFQQFNLFANRNIIDNVISAPIKLLKMPRAEAMEKGMALLKRIGLSEKAENYPDELSGGQQQRVAIARAVAMNPRILLFDEPTSALDPAMIAEILALVRQLANEGMTMMIVTHEMRFARDVSTRVLYLDEGGIYEDGTPEQIFEHPVREKTRQFIRRLRSLTIDIPAGDAFDFPGALAQIEQFGKKNTFPPLAIRILQLLFEETVMQNIVPHLISQGNGYPARCLIEHSEADRTTTFVIDYGGDSYNPITDGNPLSAKLVEGITSRVEHTCDPSNRLVLTI